MNTEILKVEKSINAGAARLFRAWLDADQFPRWFLSGETVATESAVIDPRPGGRFHIKMVHDGKVLPHEGEYQIIEEPTKLVFTWRSFATEGRDTLVTVLFKELPPEHSGPSPDGRAEGKGKARTLVTLTHERLPSNWIKAHHDGWTSILGGLAKLFGDNGNHPAVAGK